MRRLIPALAIAATLATAPAMANDFSTRWNDLESRVPHKENNEDKEKPNFTTMGVGGVGAMTCQKFLDWYGSPGVDADNIEALLEIWAMGYMSALNVSKFAIGQPRKDLNGWSHEQQRSALLNYCTKRSSAHVVDAVIALFTALPEYPEQTGE